MFFVSVNEMKQITKSSLLLILVIFFHSMGYGQDFINQEDAIVWIGKNIESSTTVPIRMQESHTEYKFGHDVRYFKLSEIKGCKLILERYDQVDGKHMVKSVYELRLKEIDPGNINMSVEKYSRNICLVLKPGNKKKIKVTRLSGKNYRSKRYLKKKAVILEFNKEALSKDIPSQMQKAFQYTIQKCKNSSTIVDYLNNSGN